MESPRLLPPDVFARLFDEFTTSAFRLEACDDYDVAGERDEFQAFLRGEPLPERTPEDDSWLVLVANATAGGKMTRVRIVGRPLTDYTRYEFACYRDNQAAGEQINVVERSQLAGHDTTWAHQDFWLFDNELAVPIRYTDRGRLLGAERASDPTPYQSIAQRALELSVNLASYTL